MKRHCGKYLISFVMACCFGILAKAQVNKTNSAEQQLDSIRFEFQEDNTILVDTLNHGTLLISHGDSVVAGMAKTEGDNAIQKQKWIPDPKKALWLAIAIPGGGQIYNRKYWKLPLIYGGFIGCFYAISWNNTMYHDYAQAYIDITDSNPDTKSFYNFLPPTYDVNANLERLQNLFKKKKDYYRRYRDLSIFCAIGVYALSVIDAYVDAELSSFDISRDLSMKIKPSVLSERAMTTGSSNSYGIKCAIAF